MMYLSGIWRMPLSTESTMNFQEYDPGGQSFLAWSAMRTSAYFSKGTSLPPLLCPAVSCRFEGPRVQA